MQQFTIQEKIKYQAALSDVLRPGAPIDKFALFAGRGEQVQDIISTIMQPGRHVILYGERGVGKTSLASVLSDLLSGMDVQLWASATVTCDGTMTFSSIWKEAFRELSILIPSNSIGFKADGKNNKVTLDKLLPDKVTPNDVRYVLQRVNRRVIIIIDEIDRIKRKDVTTLLADTIKNLSDHMVRATIILVGVATSPIELITEHHSIERALVQVPVPRMSLEELLEILEKAFDQVEMTITDEAKHYIAWLSQGLPHYTHLLGLHAAQQAINASRLDVDIEDVRQAIRVTVTKASTLMGVYQQAITSPQKNLFEQVLLACALAEKDPLGYFTAADVRGPMSAIMKRRYDIPTYSRHLYDFCDESRAAVLEKTGNARRFRFRFANPLMQPFVVIQGLANNIVPEEYIKISSTRRKTKLKH